MKQYYGYIRVSTAKQGTHGVSLIEQKAAIERYAARTNLSIIEWFEERETAAKRGRPVFTRMLNLLRKAKANGVLIHKIDRSARNLKDWADLGELIDAGVEVHFAADALDLNSRGGRLSADIQAVVAADYIRNLREETRKGFYGRLKQGLYPLAAPLGYLDQGGGKAKTPCPKAAPLVRTVFELYASGKHSLRSLQDELIRIGLRNKRGGSISLNGLSKMLSNPFYCGLIRLRATGETFKAVHEPIVSVAQFERIQQILKGKYGVRVLRHAWLFRRLMRCALCAHTLIGEKQKGRVYYRCHTRACPTTTVQEDVVEATLRGFQARAQLTPEEATEARWCLEERKRHTETNRRENQAGFSLQLADARSRMDRLTDALLDGLLDRAAFEARKGSLLLETARLEERAATATDADSADRLQEMLELATSLISSYDSADDDGKRRIVEMTTSNLSLRGKELEITPSEPFLALVNRHVVTCGDHQRDTPRTREVCHRREQIGKLIDTMITELPAKDPSYTIPAASSEEIGDRYDPSVYSLIQRKRSQYTDTGARKKFDAALQKYVDQESAKKDAANKSRARYAGTDPHNAVTRDSPRNSAS
ncbi:MAG: recombinase family protein [Deltaproteobacteria bacterium]|nr:recombinase family protein [Deltaproteobacteria bacterium]